MSMIESTEGTEAFDEPQSVGGSLLRLDPKTIAGRLRKLSGGDWEIEKGGGGGDCLSYIHPPGSSPYDISSDIDGTIPFSPNVQTLFDAQYIFPYLKRTKKTDKNST